MLLVVLSVTAQLLVETQRVVQLKKKKSIGFSKYPQLQRYRFQCLRMSIRKH